MPPLRPAPDPAAPTAGEQPPPAPGSSEGGGAGGRYGACTCGSRSDLARRYLGPGPGSSPLLSGRPVAPPQTDPFTPGPPPSPLVAEKTRKGGLSTPADPGGSGAPWARSAAGSGPAHQERGVSEPLPSSPLLLPVLGKPSKVAPPTPGPELGPAKWVRTGLSMLRTGPGCRTRLPVVARGGWSCAPLTTLKTIHCVSCPPLFKFSEDQQNALVLS
uniref:translation initiation factor IF-2-like n=1 Tax=Nyctereutes procyonoides TaxID=34880 RepID=UPI002445364D|nr:translation initiation factor IF-2-like [Nyctereutes procyonoides]